MKLAFDGKRALRNTSGLGNYARSLLMALHKVAPEHAYHIFSPKTEAASDVTFPPPGAGFHLHGPAGIYKGPLSSLWRSKGMVNDLKVLKPDLFHGLSHELPFGIHQLALKKVVTIHDLIFLRYPQYYSAIDRWIYNQKYRYACRVADLVIAISEQTKRDLIAFFGTPEKKIKVIYQGVHPRFSMQKSADDIRKMKDKLHLPGSYFLYVGAFNPRKNLLMLMEALLKFVPDARPFIVLAGRGKGSYYNKVRQFIRQNGLEPWVMICPEVASADLPALYQGACALVYPSLFEGFGLPIVEALRSRTPVITSSGSCFKEVGGPDSLYVDPDDVKGMAKSLSRLMHDAALRDEMAERGYQYARRFSGANQAQAVLKLYSGLCD